MNETFMKEKPVFPLIMSMALPMVISMLVNSLYNIVDSFFVAQISEDAMTALSLVYPVQNFVNAIAIGFGVGISSQILPPSWRRSQAQRRHGGNTGNCSVRYPRTCYDCYQYFHHAFLSPFIHLRQQDNPAWT